MIGRQLAAALLGAAIAGCGPDAKQGVSSTAGAPASAAAPGLLVTLGLAADHRSLDVEIRVTGPEVARIRALRATRGWADTRPLLAVRDLSVRDAAGAIDVGSAAEEPAFSVLPLGRPAEGGELVVRYTARTGADASRLSLHRNDGGVSAIGHSFLVRPATLASLPLTLRLRGDGGAALATSLDGRGRATVEDLADAVYVASGAPTFVSPAGDRATIAFGPRIDAASALDIVTRTRAFAARAFGPGAVAKDAGAEAEARPAVSLFVIGERGIGAEHDGAAPGSAIAVWLDAARGLDDGVKIVLSHEALHAVFGGRIRVDAGGRDAAWFSEGFATHYARRALFDEGLLGTEAFLADVARLDEGRAKSADPGDAHAIAYALGARYAALLDAAVRARSKGKRSLDDVVRRLADLAAAAEDRPIAGEALRAVVAEEIGETEERGLWLGLVAGALPELPDGAFGPCFRRTVETRAQPELGFDPSSLTGRLKVIRGTVAGSAAARAGVRDGALVLESNVRPETEISPTATVELLLAGARGKIRVVYKPVVRKQRTVFKPQACRR